MADSGRLASISAGELSAEERQAYLRGLRNLQRGIGEVAILLAAHPSYKGLFLSDLRRLVMPAVLHNQYRVIRNKRERTIGYVSWARVSETVHHRLMAGQLKLRLGDWASGEMTVVMDVAAPSAEAGERILRELKSELFGSESLWVVKTNAGAHESKLGVYKSAEAGNLSDE